jgi:hypothetical protein
MVMQISSSRKEGVGRSCGVISLGGAGGDGIVAAGAFGVKVVVV